MKSFFTSRNHSSTKYLSTNKDPTNSSMKTNWPSNCYWLSDKTTVKMHQLEFWPPNIVTHLLSPMKIWPKVALNRFGRRINCRLYDSILTQLHFISSRSSKQGICRRNNKITVFSLFGSTCWRVQSKWRFQHWQPSIDPWRWIEKQLWQSMVWQDLAVYR